MEEKYGKAYCKNPQSTNCMAAAEFLPTILIRYD